MITRDFKLDPVTGDLDTTGGAFATIADNPAIIQSAGIRLQFFQGEWFLDLLAGIPYWQKVLGKIRDPNVLQPIFRRALLDVPAAVGLQSLILQRDGSARRLRVTFELLTDLGLLAPVSKTVG